MGGPVLYREEAAGGDTEYPALGEPTYSIISPLYISFSNPVHIARNRAVLENREDNL